MTLGDAIAYASNKVDPPGQCSCNIDVEFEIMAAEALYSPKWTDEYS